MTLQGLPVKTAGQIYQTVPTGDVTLMMSAGKKDIFRITD